MSGKNPYQDFVLRYLARGAVGVSVGLAAVSCPPAAAHQQAQPAARSFSDRLALIWEAIPDSQSTELDRLAQGTIHPFPNTLPFKNTPPFRNEFDKATPFKDIPFSKAFRNRFDKETPFKDAFQKTFKNQFNKLP